MSRFLRLVAVAALACSSSILSAAPARAQSSGSADPAIAKLNAYVELMNRTLRVSESLARHASPVDMTTGPTGGERTVYDLSPVYDLRAEIENAEAAISAPPPMPELDAEMTKYIAAYQDLAPVLAEADSHDEHKGGDQAGDMAEGKALQGDLAAKGKVFLAERHKVEDLFADRKIKDDTAELAAIERQEGRKLRWHVSYVTMAAAHIVDLLTGSDNAMVDMVKFKQTLAVYAEAVKEMDEYGAADPGGLPAFDAERHALLGDLRDLDGKLGRTGGRLDGDVSQAVARVADDNEAMAGSAEAAGDASE